MKVGIKKIELLQKYLWLLLLLLPIGLYHDVLSWGFTQGEEYWFYQAYSFENIFDFFTNNTWPSYTFCYRPLSQALFVIDEYLWGGNKVGYHTTNLALMTLLVVVLYRFLKRLCESELSAAIGVALFFFSPIMVHSLSIVSHRQFLTTALLLLLMFELSALKFAVRVFIRTALLLVAFFIKESSVTFIALLLAFDCIFVHKGSIEKKLRSILSEFSIYAAATFAYLYVRLWVLIDKGILESPPAVGIVKSFYNSLVKTNYLTISKMESFIPFDYYLAINLFICGLLLSCVAYEYGGKRYATFIGCILVSCFTGVFSRPVIITIYALAIYLSFMPVLVNFFRNYSSANRDLKVLLFGFIIIFGSNIVFFSRARERVTMIALIGFSLIVAACWNIVSRRWGRRGKAVFSICFVALVSMYKHAGDNILKTQIHPDSAGAIQHQLVWFIPLKNNSKIWNKGTKKEQNLQVYNDFKQYFLDRKVIDQEDNLLIDTEKLERKAYIRYYPSSFNKKVFKLEDPVVTNSVYEMWNL